MNPSGSFWKRQKNNNNNCYYFIWISAKFKLNFDGNITCFLSRNSLNLNKSGASLLIFPAASVCCLFSSVQNFWLQISIWELKAREWRLLWWPAAPAQHSARGHHCAETQAQTLSKATRSKPTSSCQVEIHVEVGSSSPWSRPRLRLCSRSQILTLGSDY